MIQKLNPIISRISTKIFFYTNALVRSSELTVMTDILGVLKVDCVYSFIYVLYKITKGVVRE